MSQDCLKTRWLYQRPAEHMCVNMSQPAGDAPAPKITTREIKGEMRGQ
jgi:hypothetical protein